jgi:hypothetical protein
MRTLIAATAAFMLSAFAASAANAQWVGYAVNNVGLGAAWGGDEVGTRNQAIANCENNTGYTCADAQAFSIAVPTSWYIVAIECGGVRAVGGSRYSQWQAKANAASKIGRNPNRCTITHSD